MLGARGQEKGGWEHILGKQAGGRRQNGIWAKALKPLEYIPLSHQTSLKKLLKTKDEIITSLKTETMKPFRVEVLCYCTSCLPMKLVLFPVLHKWLWKGTMLNTTKASLKGMRTGNGTVYGHRVNAIFQKFPEGRRRKESQPPFYTSSLSLFHSNKSDKGRLSSCCRSGRYCIEPWGTGRENGWLIIININLEMICGIHTALFSKDIQAHYSLIFATYLCDRRWRGIIFNLP